MRTVGIVGAGPAGLSCALWLKNLGFQPYVIESAKLPAETVAQHFQPNHWLLGFNSVPGGIIRNLMVEHIHNQNISVLTETHLTQISREDNGFIINFASTSLFVEHLVLASGTSPTSPPDISLLAKAHPSLIQIGPGSQGYLTLSNKTIGILGGGDNAFEHAILLANQGNQVCLYLRGQPRARIDFVKAVQNHPQVKIFTNTVISDLATTEHGITFYANAEPQQVSYLMVMYGFTPNTQWLAKAAPWTDGLLDQNGFIQVDSQQRTSFPYVYAAGDVTNFQIPCIPVALAQGAVAAKSIEYDSKTNNE